MASRRVDAEGVLGGRYRLVRSIASGGMAEVWRAEDDILGRPVAVKVLHAHLAADNSFLARFRREAIAAARLAHPNVVATYDTGVDDGVAWIVMELVEGSTLRQVVSTSGALPPHRAVHIATQVADALDYAHRTGVIHRDVKPGNILLAEGDRVKVADFGIAKAAIEAAEDSSGPGIDATDLTQSGAIVGTAKYLSPEQVHGEPVDGRSDVYALGVVLYEMLCGRVPFTGDTDVAVAVQHATATPVSPRQVRPDLPPALEAVVLQAMAKSPDDRYQTAAELRAALVAVGGRVDGSGPGSGPPADPATLVAAPAPARAPAPPDLTMASAGSDRTPPRGAPALARPRRSWALPATLGTVLVLTLGIVGVLFARSDTGRRILNPPADSGSEGRPVAITSAAAFDPPPGSGSEHDDDVANLTDGNPTTTWATELYGTASFGGLKTGVGVILTVEGVQTLEALEVISPSQGWGAEVYVAVSAKTGAPPGNWGAPVASRDGIAGTATFELGSRRGSVVLLWITQLAGGGEDDEGAFSVVVGDARLTS